MLARQKIKMEDSFHQIQHNQPYFQHQEPTYSKNSNNHKLARPQIGNSHQHIKYPSFKTDYSQEQQRPYAARTQILKELRQQFEILRNLSIEEIVHVPIKKGEPRYQKYDQNESQLSSSVVSKQNKTQDYLASKQNNRQIQSLYLEKKQLELVIGNSLRKIEELLNNQISLKKTIHELKNQIEGKGGITMEYEKTIRSLQKNQQELQAQLNKLKHENDKNLQKIKDQNEKIRTIQSQQQKKERQIKQAFDQQRRLHDLLRVQKDKYMNLEIQCRSYKMEFEMLQKQKNNEINRLFRQFQGKEGGNQREMAFIIKKLEQEIKQKDKRYHDLLLQRQNRKQRQSDVIQLDKKYGDKDKSYLQQILFRSREINQNNNKAFTDGMNMIFTKMAELQKKNDENIKKQIAHIKKKAEEVNSVRKNSQIADRQLSTRIIQLQRIIERQVSQKQKLISSIKQLNEEKSSLQEKLKQVQKKLKDHYSRKQNGLVQKFSKEFQEISENYRAVQNTYNALKAEYVVISQKLKNYEAEEFNHKQGLENQNITFKEKEKKLEEEIRNLKRRIDQASFQAEKNKKQGQMNLNIYRTSQQSENKRLVGQNQRISSKLRQTEERLAKLQKQLETKLKLKQAEVAQLKNIIENLKIKLQQQLLNQKKIYEDRIAQIQSRHSLEMKGFSEKFIGVTSVNQKLMGQLSQMGRLESQLMQLRRVLKSNRSTSSGIDHLWQIKQTEYGNITHILSALHEGYYK